MRYVIFVVFLAVLIAEFLHPINMNQDLGRHLLLGQIITQTKQIPTTNLLSYTYPQFLFINSHWLSEVIFYLVDKTVGLTGLLFLTVTVVLSFYAILFWTHLRKNSAFSLGVASFLFAGIFFDRTDIRPELFSFLFFAIFLAILFKHRQKVTKWILLLPFLALFWVNIHIYFLIGPITVGLFLIDALIEKYVLHKKQPFPLLLAGTFLATCIATLGNPHALQGALYPFFVFQNYGYTIAENQNVFFLQSVIYAPGIIFFEVSATTLGLLLLIQWKKSRSIDWLLFIVFTYLGISAARNTPLFAVATFGILARNITFLQESLQDAPWIKKSRKTVFTAIPLLILFGGILWETLFFTSLRPIGIHVDAEAADAITFFQKNHLHGPIFNNFDIGSYILYRLYPQEKVFVDGRPEAYPADFFQKTYIPMQENPTIFEKIDAKYHFQTIVFAHTDITPWAQKFLQTIMKDTVWKAVYLDSSMLILVKNTPANAYLPQITEHAFSDKDTQDLNAHMRLAYFLDIIGWKEAEKTVLQNILATNPSFCPALFALGKEFYSENNIPMAQIYSTKLTACR